MTSTIGASDRSAERTVPPIPLTMGRIDLDAIPAAEVGQTGKAEERLTSIGATYSAIAETRGTVQAG